MAARSPEDFFNGLRFANLVDLDCVNYDTYAYSTVSVPSDPTAPLAMKWRTAQKARRGGGRPLPDLLKPGDFCDETLAPGVYPE